MLGDSTACVLSRTGPSCGSALKGGLADWCCYGFCRLESRSQQCLELMSPLHVWSKVCMAPLLVQSKVCIAPIHVRSKVCQFPSHMYRSNADFATHMEESHADLAPHLEWRHSFEVKIWSEIAQEHILKYGPACD